MSQNNSLSYPIGEAYSFAVLAQADEFGDVCHQLPHFDQ